MLSNPRPALYQNCSPNDVWLAGFEPLLEQVTLTLYRNAGFSTSGGVSKVQLMETS